MRAKPVSWPASLPCAPRLRAATVRKGQTNDPVRGSRRTMVARYGPSEPLEVLNKNKCQGARVVNGLPCYGMPRFTETT
ncbi:hypothetical protein K456DRAFT_46231 [Colletotrichum gloeosporioides 23]|nr:hypothetical protein K456DRAFT_46231 [Colletotrichum gloeosporioides 23]